MQSAQRQGKQLLSNSEGPMVMGAYSLLMAPSVIAVRCFLLAVVTGRERVDDGIDLGLGLCRQSSMEG